VTKPSSRTTPSSPRPAPDAAGPRAKPKKSRPKPPENPGSARIVAIANQKGGVGKSTTAVSLGAALAELGYRILVVDLDPQGNASTGIGIRHEDRKVTSYDVIVAEAPLEAAIVHSAIQGLDAIPSTIDLAGAEIELVSQFSREGRLKRALAAVKEGVYDFVFLDCPPSLGLITVNALTAAEELIVPIQCEYYALEGLGQLLRNVSLVQQNINQELRLTGIVMTMFDPRTKLSEQVVEEVQRYFGKLVYDSIIPRTVRLSEAPGYGVPITVYDPKSKGAESYRALAAEVAVRPVPDAPMATFEDLPVMVAPQLVQDAVPEGPLGDDALEEQLPTVHRVLDEHEWPVPAEGVGETTSDAPPTGAAPERDVGEPGTRPEAFEAAPDVSASSDVVARSGDLTQTEADAEPRPPVAPAQAREATTPPAGAESGIPVVGETDADEIWESPEERPRVRAVESDPGQLPERRVVVIDEDADVRRASGSKDPPDPEIGATLHDDAQKRRWRLFRKGGE
jgi:chromosome partitioning protein